MNAASQSIPSSPAVLRRVDVAPKKREAYEKTTPMRTIAISRLVVSEGATIARRVTEALAYTLVNKSVLEGIFRQHGLTKFADLYTSPPNLWDLANAKNLQLVSMLNDTMDALAHRGDMLRLGRGGYASLSKYEDVLNVRLQASFLVRVERVMARENIDNRLRAISTEMATDWIIEAARALSAKKFRANAVTVDRAKVDPSLLDAIDIPLARQAFA
jgi:cytidylate kinase